MPTLHEGTGRANYPLVKTTNWNKIYLLLLRYNALSFTSCIGFYHRCVGYTRLANWLGSMIPVHAPAIVEAGTGSASGINSSEKPFVVSRPRSGTGTGNAFVGDVNCVDRYYGRTEKFMTGAKGTS